MAVQAVFPVAGDCNNRVNQPQIIGTNGSNRSSQAPAMLLSLVQEMNKGIQAPSAGTLAEAAGFPQDLGVVVDPIRKLSAVSGIKRPRDAAFFNPCSTMDAACADAPAAVVYAALAANKRQKDMAALEEGFGSTEGHQGFHMGHLPQSVAPSGPVAALRARAGTTAVTGMHESPNVLGLMEERNGFLVRSVSGLPARGQPTASTSGCSEVGLQGVGAVDPVTLASLAKLQQQQALQAAVLQHQQQQQQQQQGCSSELSEELLRAMQVAEPLKRMLEENFQRRQAAFVSAMQDECVHRLRLAGLELERQRLHSAKLEEHVRRLSSELSLSHSRLRSSELIVHALKSNLEHAVALSREEHTGDSEEVDDAASSHEGDLAVSHARALRENEELREQRACRICRTNDATTLLMPCRHLCLCHACDMQLAECPRCGAKKEASVIVYMS